MAIADVIGVSLPRVEGREKVTGTAGYTADLLLPGMLWGKILRSTEPHARLVRVDASKARQMAGVRAVLTGADLGGLLTGSRQRDVPVLCSDKVRFIGDATAAVAADDPEVADEALNAIEVEYEALPAVFEPADALEPGAPVLHERAAAYKGRPEGLPDEPNLQSAASFGRGDVEQGFAESDHVFDHTFVAERVHQGYIEPRACAVQIDGNGTVHVWSSCKVPYRLRGLMADLFGLERDKVVVERATIGGDFGAKGEVGPEPIAYALARATGQPVKIVRGYVEELQAGAPRHKAIIRVRTGVKKDGSIVAREMRITMDGGAYGGLKYNPQLILPSVNRGLGPYKMAHSRIEARWAYTNNVPGGIARAPGQPQVVFAGESQMDVIAEALGMDPIELRLRNIVGDGDDWPVGSGRQGVMARKTLELARSASGWDEPLGPWRGRGVAISERGIGSGASGLVVTLHTDGHVSALSGVPDIGVGAFTVLRQILSEQLHVPLDAVTVYGGNTSEALTDSGTGGSKGTYSVSFAAFQAVPELNQRLAELAAARLECADEDLEPASTDYHVKGSPDRHVATVELVAEAAERAGGTLATRSAGPGHDDRAQQMCSVACVAEVEVDPDTGHVTPVKITMANDVGYAINPRLMEGQIEGATIQGLGIALMEDLSAQEGRIGALHLGDYKLPVIADLPELVSVLVEGAPGPGPYAAKAVGELGVIPVAAAFANAVAKASGVRVATLPITAEKVRAGIPSPEAR
ncbi:MAG: xanthine dehydrogenase family protein molybdopterin-binding subunit [Chloroflexota bacterium]